MKNLLEKYKNLEDDASQAEIEKTAQDLERRNFMPVLILEVKNFYYLTKEKMLAEFNRVMNLNENDKEIKQVVAIESIDEIKEKHLATLLNQYYLLCDLRAGKAEAWDTVNELYEDD